MEELKLLTSAEASKELGISSKQLRKTVRKKTPDILKMVELSFIVKSADGWHFARDCFEAIRQAVAYSPERKKKNRNDFVRKDADVYPVPPELTDGSARWFGLRVTAGREEMVYRLMQVFRTRGLYDLDKVEVFMPTWKVKDEDGKISREEAVFHKILFIRTAQISQVYYNIRQTSMHIRGWWTSVKGSGVPCMIPEDYIEMISKEYEYRIKESEIRQKVKSLSVGMYMRVIEGPFKGFVGQITELGSLIKVELPIFGRLTGVALGPTQVDKLEEAALKEAGVIAA